ncbi:MAG: hypothetical protein SVY53_11345 [Chloroflexota bacterium]|nr:hypothetical protein [Chloroflexota bacterium]
MKKEGNSPSLMQETGVQVDRQSYVVSVYHAEDVVVRTDTWCLMRR